MHGILTSIFYVISRGLLIVFPWAFLSIDEVEWILRVHIGQLVWDWDIVVVSDDVIADE